MTVLLDATDAQIARLAELAEALRMAEQTIAGMQAARDGMLAMASALALEIARAGRHPDHGDMTLRAIAAEIGAAQRVSDRTVERRMDEASWLIERFPRVWEAQGAGRISAAHARVIVDAGAHLDDSGDREGYAARVLAAAETESANRLRRIARRMAEQFQARTVDERHRDAREVRRIWVKDLDDGMAELGMLGPAVLVHGMHDRLTQMAHSLKRSGSGEDAGAGAGLAARASAAAGAGSTGSGTGGPGVRDERTTDQLRADLLADIVLTGAPVGHDTDAGLLGEIQARVEVTVPVLTLMDDHSPGASASPPAELDVAHQSTRPLLGSSRRHHMLKHHSPWHVRQSAEGPLEWRSPSGRVYADRAPEQNTVRFAQSHE